MNKNVFGHLSYLLLITMFACTATDRNPQTPGTPDRPTVQAEPVASRPCRQIVWRDNNTNRYDYRFDSSQQLSQCTAFEQTSNHGTYALSQQLTYTKNGLLERVRDEEDSSRYHYRNRRLTSIDFFQEGQPVYRYLVTTNEQGQIVGLRGLPLNDSGLPAYATRYRLDGQGRYVQLDMEDDHGRLYYRVKQFQPAARSLTPMGDSGPLEMQANKQNYSLFDQRDDYSYINNSNYTLNPRVTAYQGGTIFYGVEPTGVSSGRLAVAEVAPPLRVVVLGNPVVGSQVEVLVMGAEGQPVRLELMDVSGRGVSGCSVERAGALERQTLALGRQPGGLLLLRVSTPGQSQTVKIITAN